MSFKDLFKEIVGNENLSIVHEPTATVSKVDAALAVTDSELANIEKNIAQLVGSTDTAEINLDQLDDNIQDLAINIAGVEKMFSGETEFNPALCAHYYKSAVKITTKFGGSVQHQGIESFQDKDNVAAEVYSGMEGIKDIAKKAGAKIKEIFIQLYQGFLALFDQFLNQYKTLGQKASRLHREAGAYKNYEPKMTLPGTCAFVEDNGDADDIVKFVIGHANGLKSAFDTSNRGEEGFQKEMAHLAAKVKENGKAKLTGSTESTEIYDVTYVNGQFTLVVPKTNEGLKDLNIKDIMRDSSPREVSTLPAGGLVALCKKIETNCNILAGINISSRGLKTIRDRGIALAETNPEDSKLYTDFHRGMLKFTRGASQVALRALTGQITFVETQLKAKVVASE